MAPCRESGSERPIQFQDSPLGVVLFQDHLALGEADEIALHISPHARGNVPHATQQRIRKETETDRFHASRITFHASRFMQPSVV